MRVSRSSPLCLGLAALLCLCSSATCKPTNSRRAAEVDPMMAMPSEGNYEQQGLQVAGPAQEVHYVTSQQQPPQQEVVIEYQPVGGAPGGEQQQQLVYRQHEAAPQSAPTPYQLVHVPVQVDASGAPTSSSEPGQGNYPGEIVYMGQSGEQNESSLAYVASSLQQNDGLSATILTEVPLRDMPHEVLNKLRREYGVKVVATRERPGANLVITCDEHSANRESAICNKQHQQEAHHRQAHYQGQPQAPEQHHFYQQPQQAAFEYAPLEQQAGPRPRPRRHREIRTQVIHINHEMAEPVGRTYAAGGPHEQEPHVQMFAHRGVMSEEVGPEHQTYQVANSGQEQAQAGGEGPSQAVGQHESELYGARTATTAAVGGEQPTEGGHEAANAPGAEQTGAEQTAGHEQPGETTQAAGHEALDQNSGFDEQASKGNEHGQAASAAYGQ